LRNLNGNPLERRIKKQNRRRTLVVVVSEAAVIVIAVLVMIVIGEACPVEEGGATDPMEEEGMVHAGMEGEEEEAVVAAMEIVTKIGEGTEEHSRSLPRRQLLQLLSQRNLAFLLL
jgi:hypothetical protein